MRVRYILLVALVVLAACTDDVYETTGTASEQPRSRAVLEQNDRQQASVAPGPAAKHILFGDLHVHSTFSMDAFDQSQIFAGGEGAHPIADACDYARYCSQLDFWSINDHAISLTPDRWQLTREAIRQCNAVAADVPDTVAFTGWEWTNIGSNIDNHWGHKNVIFPGDLDEDLPPRPIRSGGAAGPEFNVPMDTVGVITAPLKGLITDSGRRGDHWQHLQYLMTTFSASPCDNSVPTRDLPHDCLESADNPAELFKRLDQWSDDYMVIPHGTSWGLYTPPGSAWRKQLPVASRQPIIEVYSGHGNSEEYRSWRAVAVDDNGEKYCPEPSDGYIPCCWQAGEIIRKQCDSPVGTECEQQVEEARANAVAAGASGHLTLTNVKQEDWLNCGQCPDCFLPSYELRPGMSAQAGLAVSEQTEQGVNRFRYGFIGASDNHGSRPGTGYKEVQRSINVDFVKGDQQILPARVGGAIRSILPEDAMGTMATVFNRERGEAMLYTGGLAAVHSEDRSREAIWAGLKRKEVYGTSGPRMLLWFDHIDEAGEIRPMGSELQTDLIPRFRVRAVGAFKQKPGCPDFASQALGQDRLQRLCGSECYHPTDTRNSITRIEVIKVYSQTSPEEDIGTLIQDPWRILSCENAGDACVAEFEDESFGREGRDVSYYVRAIQEATPTINGSGLRCEYDEQGVCSSVNLCYSNNKTARGDDCLAPVEHRAWSSPIYMDYVSL